MKSLLRLSLMAAFTLMLSHQSNAQAFFGIYGGTNSAGLQMNNWKTNADPLDTKPTFQSIRRLTFGLTCELPLSRSIIFQPEIAWTTKGGIMSIDSGYSDISGSGQTTWKTVNNLDLHYLQVPMLIKWRIQLTNPQPMYPHEGTGKPWFFELYGGPVFNYLLIPRTNYSQTVTHIPAGATDPDNTVKNVYNSKVQGGVKHIDFSAAIGGNIKWRMNKKTFLYVGARYSLNFMNINSNIVRNDYLNSEGNPTISYPSIKNSGNMALTVGITRTFTKRRYWNIPRMKNRRF
ncbi:MAG: outer membrane beta-barrel protein [Bacteroidetes bacterium]|nr:outer membrane beta-barrel protein [Bacteroidota bacterium]